MDVLMKKLNVIAFASAPSSIASYFIDKKNDLQRGSHQKEVLCTSYFMRKGMEEYGFYV
jgi:hypothetical protein